MSHTLKPVDRVESACKRSPLPQGPLSRLFWTSEGPKIPQNGLKMGSFHPLVHPKWTTMIFGKMRFRPSFDPFLVPKEPIFKAFWDFRMTKMGHHKLKIVQKHLF